MSATGNAAATRPTKTNPIACDCCDQPTDFFNSSRSEISRPGATLPYVICHRCAEVLGCDGPDARTRLRFVVRRAARFGIQWEEAVKALLGWPA